MIRIGVSKAVAILVLTDSHKIVELLNCLIVFSFVF